MDENESKETQGQGREVERFERLEHAAERQIKRLGDAYETHASLMRIVVLSLSGLGSVIAAVLAFGFYHSMNEFKDSLRDDLREKERAMARTMDSSLADMTNRINMYIYDQEQRVDTLISNRFGQQNIDLLIGEKVQGTVDKVTEKTIDASIKRIIEPKLNALTNTIADVQEQVGDAMSSSAEVRSTLDLAMDIVRALNDDRTAFFDLHQIQISGTNRYQGLINEAVNTVLSEQGEMQNPFNRWSWSIDWKSLNFNPETNSFEDFAKLLVSPGDPYLGVILLQKGDDESRFPYEKKLQLYGEILANSQSLRLVSKTCSIIDKRAHLQMNIFGIPKYLEWVNDQRREVLITNFSNLILSNRNSGYAFLQRGYLFDTKSNFVNAAKDYEAALSVEPHNPTNLNAIAWFRATCVDDSMRDGKRAVKLAREACEASNWKVWNYVGTLGASYAEVGDFGKAAKFEEQAIELLRDDTANVSAEERRLEMFRVHKVLRERQNWP